MYNLDALWQEFYRRMAQKAESMADPATGMVRRSYVSDVPCPYCRSTDYDPRVVVHGFRYVTCRQCGLVYLNPQLTGAALRDAYNDEDVRAFFFRELLLPFGEQAQKQEYEQRVRDLKKLTNRKTPRLLDIGCAAGNFLQIAQGQGFDGEGLELNSHYVEYIREHRHLKVAARRLDEMSYEDCSFDIVTLWDVLEHVPQPFELLKEIVRILRPAGILALTTINHRCINEKILGSRWRYYQPPDHVCSFTPKVLSSMIRDAGCEIVTMNHHYMFEVFADAQGGMWQPSRGRTLLAAVSNKIKKGIYVALAGAAESVFNALQSGDLLTVYARKP